MDKITYFHTGSWTKQDIEDVDVLKEATIPHTVRGLRRHKGYISVYLDNDEVLHMRPEFFPSLAMGEVATLSMIKIGG